MAQIDGMQQPGGTSKTVEQLLHSDSPSAWNVPSTLGRVHDQEEDNFHHSKKISAIAKLKEKAKKLRQILIRKRHGNDSDNNTPSWGVALEDYEVEEDTNPTDPMYESDHTADINKRISRHYAKAKADRVSNIEKRVLGININRHSSAHGPALVKSYSDHQTGNPSNLIMSDTLRAKSFGNYQNEKVQVPSTSNTTIEALMAYKYKNADLHEPHSEMTTETASTEMEENTSEKMGATRDVNGNNIAVEHKEKLHSLRNSPRKLKIANVLDKSIAYEQKLSSPRKSTTPKATGKSIAYEQEDNLSPRKIPTQFMIDKSTANEHVETLPSPRNTVIDKNTKYGQEEELPRLRKISTQRTTEESSAYDKKEKFFSPMKTDNEETEKFVSPREMNEANDAENTEAEEEHEKRSPTTKKTITEAVSEKLAPAYATVSEATHKITSTIQGLSTALPIQGMGSSEEERKWDKGVSVKEYLKSKLEPGEDERALSQVISEAISPRRSPTEKGVVEKVKEAATTFFLNSEEPVTSTSLKNSDSSSQIPISTNAHEVEEENQGRILQAN